MQLILIDSRRPMTSHLVPPSIVSSACPRSVRESSMRRWPSSKTQLLRLLSTYLISHTLSSLENSIYYSTKKNKLQTEGVQDPEHMDLLEIVLASDDPQTGKPFTNEMVRRNILPHSFLIIVHRYTACLLAIFWRRIIRPLWALAGASCCYRSTQMCRSRSGSLVFKYAA